MAEVEKGMESKNDGGNIGAVSTANDKIQGNLNLVSAILIFILISIKSVHEAVASVFLFGSRDRLRSAHQSDDIETGHGPTSIGSHVTRSSTTDFGGNTGAGTSFHVIERAQETQNLFVVIAIGILALIMQIFSFINLPHQFLFHSVIICATTLSTTSSLLVVFDIVRRAPASPLKPVIYVALLCFFTSFLVHITTLSFHHFFLLFSIYVLVALSIFFGWCLIIHLP